MLTRHVVSLVLVGRSGEVSDTGDCDLVFCAEFVATFVGFPSGSWQLREALTSTTADIVVP